MSKGVPAADIMINYTPFGHSDWQSIVADIKKFGSAGKKTAVVSTINGDANVPFYKELAAQKISAEDIPVVAFSVGEEELSGLDCRTAGWPSGGLELLPERQQSAEHGVDRQVAGVQEGHKKTFNDPMEATVLGFQLWVQAVEKADVDGDRQGRGRHHRPRRRRT